MLSVLVNITSFDHLVSGCRCDHCDLCHHSTKTIVQVACDKSHFFVSGDVHFAISPERGASTKAGVVVCMCHPYATWLINKPVLTNIDLVCFANATSTGPKLVAGATVLEKSLYSALSDNVGDVPDQKTGALEKWQRNRK